MLSQVLLGLLLTSGVFGQFRNGSDCNVTNAEPEDIQWNIDCNGTGNGNDTDCADLGIQGDPCLDDPCPGNATCVDLTQNGTECNETAWEDFLFDNYNLTLDEFNTTEGGFVCLGFGNGSDCADMGIFGNPCDSDPCNSTDECVDLTMNGTNCDQDDWADLLENNYNLSLADFNDTEMGYVCLSDGNETSDCSDWGIDGNPCDSDPCNGTEECVDLTMNGTVCDEEAWDEYLQDNYNMSLLEANNTGDGFVCLGDDNSNGTDCVEMGIFGNPCDADSCNGTEECVDLTANGTICDEEAWDEFLMDNYNMTLMDFNETSGGFVCMGDSDDNSTDSCDEMGIFGDPCSNSTCDAGDECVDLTMNGTVCDENEWADFLMENYNMSLFEFNTTDEGYVCIGSGMNGTCAEMGIFGDPCSTSTCQDGAECFDLTSNGTVCDEDEWEELLMDNFNMSLADFNTTDEGYVCLRMGTNMTCEEMGIFGDPCLDEPCGGNGTCIDLTDNGTTCNMNDWDEFLLDNYNMTYMDFNVSGDGFVCMADDMLCDNPCMNDTCAVGECIDLTVNGTVCNEGDWEVILEQLYNMTWNDTDDYGDGYACIVDEMELPCEGMPCGNATCVDLTSNGTNWNVSDWADYLWEEYGIEDDNATHGYECLLPCDFRPCDKLNATCIDLTMNGTVWNDDHWADYLWDNHELEDNNSTYGYECVFEEDPVSPCESEPCGNATCIDLSANGTIWNESYWAELLWNEYGLEDNNETAGYECLLPCDFRPCESLNATCVDLTMNGTIWNDDHWADYLWDNHEVEDMNHTYGYECVYDKVSPCEDMPCGNATCVDLTMNGTIWNETYWAELLMDEYGLMDGNETEGYECLLPCDFRPCDALNATCVDLTMNGTVWNDDHWADYLWDNHEMDDDNSTYGYECVFEKDPVSPCESQPCGNATCVDLSANGTIWNETFWAELLWDEYGLTDNNETEGYECLLPCDFRPCDALNATCVDLTLNGSVWNEDHWEDWLMDNHELEYSNETYGYECVFEEDREPPCDAMPCGNLTCVDLTVNGTVWDASEHADLLWDLHGMEDDNSTEGYECLLPCDFRPCDTFNATCLDLTANGSIWNEDAWSDWLADEYAMEYDGDSEGYECLLEPPCDSDPCDALNLTCIDLTMNGTNWNESYWQDWFADEYENDEYDNSTYGYQCIDPFTPPPCASNPCQESEMCLDPTLNGTNWNETFWKEWLWENYRVEYDNTTEGYECYVPPPMPCEIITCNKFERCKNVDLEGEWNLVHGIWMQFRGECEFLKKLCPKPVGEKPSPVPNGKFPIHWKGSKANFLWKQLHFNSDNNKIMRHNMKNDNADLVGDIRSDGYVGFMYFSRKSCGDTFLNAIMDYKIHFRIFDFTYMYDVSYRYKRSQGKKSGVVLQFRQHTAINCATATPKCSQKFTDMGNAKLDQFYIEVIGPEGEDLDPLYSTTWKACHEKVALGAMKQDYAVIDPIDQGQFTENPIFDAPLYDFNSTYNYAQCASYSFTFW